MLDEFYRVAFPKEDLRSITELQAELDRWIQTHSEEQPHQGRWCFGKKPKQTFLDAKPSAKEKTIAALARSTRGSDPALDAVCQTKFQLLHLTLPSFRRLPSHQLVIPHRLQNPPPLPQPLKLLLRKRHKRPHRRRA
jgi:hypothetical protein